MRYFSSEAVSHYPQKTAEMEIDLNRNSNLTLARYADNPQVWTKKYYINFIFLTMYLKSILFSDKFGSQNDKKINFRSKSVFFYFDVLENMFPIQKNFMKTLVFV